MVFPFRRLTQKEGDILMAMELKTTGVNGFVKPAELTNMETLLNAVNDELLTGKGAGSDFLGWLDLPVNYDKEEFARIQKAAKKIQSDSDVLVVIGIGGSYLGARAAIEFCKGQMYNGVREKGINVYKMRYAGVMISGVLGGLGGLVYITAGVSEWKFENGVAGFGFLALAVMIFGQWKPLRIALAALLFGLFRSLSNVYTGFDFLAQLNLPSTFYNMLPYIISLLVLALTSSKSRAPKAEGIPYDKGSR